MTVTLHCTGDLTLAHVAIEAPEDEYNKVADVLVDLHFLPNGPDKAEGFGCSGQYAIAFWTEGLWSLPEDWNLLVPEAMQKVAVKDAPSALRFRSDADGPGPLLRTRLVLLQGDRELAREALLEAAEAKRRFVALGEAEVGRVDPEAPGNALVFERHRTATFVKHPAVAAELEKGGEVVLPLAFAPALAGPLLKGASREATENGERMGAVVDAGRGLSNVVPEGLALPPYEYQRHGIRFLRNAVSGGYGAILADDLGLGKSGQTLACFLGLKEAHGHVRAIIIAPTTLQKNWEREAKKFTPSLNVHIWAGPRRHKDVAKARAADVLIVSYPLIRIDAAVFDTMEWQVAAFDEAHVLRTAHSETAKAARRVKAKVKFCLSGTIIENRPSDLKSIADIVCPGLLGSDDLFDRMYGRGIAAGDKPTISRLRCVLSPYIIRRLRSECQKYLPECQEIDFQIPMTDPQAELYSRLKKDLAKRVDLVLTNAKASAMQRKQAALVGLIRLRQCATDPRLLKHKDGKNLQVGEEYSGKIAALRDLLTETSAAGTKVLVFCEWVEALHLIRSVVEEMGISYEYLDGSTKDRMGAVDRFQEDPSKLVFLLGQKAGGTGLTLTAAQVVVLYTPWWAFGVENQCIGRAHRNGQQKNVIVYRFISSDTIENYVVAVMSNKRIMAASVLDGGEAAMETPYTVAEMRKMLDG